MEDGIAPPLNHRSGWHYLRRRAVPAACRNGCLDLQGISSETEQQRARLAAKRKAQWLDDGCVRRRQSHTCLSKRRLCIQSPEPYTRGYEFINSGLNGNTSLDLLGRLDEIVQCQPDAVSVMIGTNDVRTSFSKAAEHAFEQNIEGNRLAPAKRDPCASCASLSVTIGGRPCRGGESAR